MEIFVIVSAVIVGTLSAARITRLLTADSFPPVVWARIKWDTLTENSGWGLLAHCHWCLSVWITPPILIWALLSDLHWSWWVFNGCLASAYAAGMIVERDEKD